ncbi:MAG: hypothetical protein JW772_00455, partial [Candidatus Diapherotrites archaeon]|nr:hypothetical protein [Candidatus Diapherotrites archaeon]
KKAKGKRAKTRSKLTRRHRPLTISRLLPDLKSGQSVQINIDPAVHSGMPSSRFQGFTGRVTGKQGKVYSMRVMNGNAELELFVHPAHLKVIEENSGKKVEKVAA